MSPRAYSQEPSPSQSSALRSAPQISARVAPDSGVRGRTRSRSRSQSRSVSPVARRRSSSVRHSRSRSRTPHLQDHTNGHGARGLRPSRSPLQTRDERRSYRQRSYSRGSSRQDRRIESSKIVVEKLTRNVTEAHLQEIFGAYGRIHSIDIPMNRQFMTNRGSAYIVYDSAAGSESAIAHMHEAQLDGAVITVSIVLPRRAFSRSPPPARIRQEEEGMVIAGQQPTAAATTREQDRDLLREDVSGPTHTTQGLLHVRHRDGDHGNLLDGVSEVQATAHTPVRAGVAVGADRGQRAESDVTSVVDHGEAQSNSP